MLFCLINVWLGKESKIYYLLRKIISSFICDAKLTARHQIRILSILFLLYFCRAFIFWQFVLISTPWWWTPSTPDSTSVLFIFRGSTFCPRVHIELVRFRKCYNNPNRAFGIEHVSKHAQCHNSSIQPDPVKCTLLHVVKRVSQSLNLSSEWRSISEAGQKCLDNILGQKNNG